MNYIILTGRVSYSLIFLMTIFSNFSQKTIDHAVSQGVPLASIAVPLSGLIAILGGLSVALGYKAKWGSWLLVLFLIPVTIMMHNFWSINDPMMAQMQQIEFMKNLALLGTALFISQMGSGPLSLDNRNKR
jgi:putative oxidoreductase